MKVQILNLPSLKTLLFCLFATNSTAQTETNSLAIASLLKKGEAMLTTGKFDSAMIFGQQALGLFPKTSNQPNHELSEIYLHLGRCYIYTHQLDSGCVFVQSALENLDSTARNSDRQLSIAWELASTCATDTKGDFEEGFQCLQKAKMYADRTGDTVQIATAIYRLGMFMVKKYDLRAAIHHLESAQKLLDQTKVSERSLSLKARCLANIGTAYGNLEQPQKAIPYTRGALDLLEKLTGPDSRFCALQHENLSGHLDHTQQDSAAQVFHARRAVEIYRKVPPRSPEDLPTSLIKLGKAMLRIRNFMAAEQAFQEALSLCNDEMPNLKYSILNGLGNVKSSQNQLVEALELFQQALEVLQSAKMLPSDLQNCHIYEWLGELKIAMGDFDGAAQDIDAYIAVSGLQGESLGTVRYSTAALSGTRLKGKMFFEKFRKTSDPQDLKSSGEQLDFYERLLEDFHRSGKFESHHTDEIHKAADLAIAQKFAENQQLASEKAFAWAERSHAVTLLNSVRQSDALQFSGIPDSLLEYERNLEKDLAHWQKKQQQAQEQSGSPQTQFDGQVAQLLLDREKLQGDFERAFPQYFKLKYDRSVVSVAEVQRDLFDPDQALLEYFVGDSSIFIFKIEKEKFELREVKKDFPLEKWVAELRDATTKFFTNSNFEKSYDSLAQVFCEKSHLLFQKLVAPVAQNLPPRLVIVPDGVLGYLPFEALLTEPLSAAANRWQLHNYLIFKHSVQYCPSATMLREMSFRKTKTEPTHSFFGFAPHFSGDTTTLGIVFQNDLTMRKDLAPLPFSGEEVARLSKLMRGRYLAGADASKSAFLAAAPTAKILHLATHGQANDRTGDYCFLAFAKTQNPKLETENSLLFAREIYNLSLNADLVVLSACETGIGQLQNGEGIISLARAFAFAGAKSIVTSFWSVSDSKTKDLMLDFYKNLRRGEAKDLALRQAKLDFLRKNRGQTAHPFFWAGFVGMGSF